MPFQENLGAARAAIELVRQQLAVQSSNHPRDAATERSMGPLGIRKAALSDLAFDGNQEKAKALAPQIESLKLQNAELLVRQRTLGEALAKLEKGSKDAEAMGRQNAALREARRLVMEKLSAAERQHGALDSLTARQDLEVTAQAAADTKLGNCDEMSALAFFWLQSTAIRPVELFATHANGDNDQHQFVVIGRPATASLKDPAEWTGDAVVCDPWDGAAYPAADLRQRLGQLGYPTEWSLCDSADR